MHKEGAYKYSCRARGYFVNRLSQASSSEFSSSRLSLEKKRLSARDSMVSRFTLLVYFVTTNNYPAIDNDGGPTGPE